MPFASIGWPRAARRVPVPMTGLLFPRCSRPLLPQHKLALCLAFRHEPGPSSKPPPCPARASSSAPARLPPSPRSLWRSATLLPGRRHSSSGEPWRPACRQYSAATSFRASGITAFLKAGGTVEAAAGDGRPCFHPHDAALRPSGRIRRRWPAAAATLVERAGQRTARRLVELHRRPRLRKRELGASLSIFPRENQLAPRL